MLKQREQYSVSISKIALERIRQNKCAVCAKPKPEWNRRKDFRCCSVQCTRRFWKDYAIVNSWNEVRSKVLYRDRYRCVKCGKKSSRLIADHIKAIALGGDEWDISNIQTLCASCNKLKTAEDMKRIILQRNIEKQYNEEEQMLFEL